MNLKISRLHDREKWLRKTNLRNIKNTYDAIIDECESLRSEVNARANRALAAQIANKILGWVHLGADD